MTRPPCVCECSLGGIVMASKDGKIVLDNTLDARMQIVFKQQLPEVGLYMLHCQILALNTQNPRHSSN